MAARAIIFHGTGGHPDYCWYPWLGARLEARGYLVEIPHYPGLNRDPLETFLPKVLASHVFDHETVLVGHSGGAALVLAILEHIEARVAQAILVSRRVSRPLLVVENALGRCAALFDTRRRSTSPPRVGIGRPLARELEEPFLRVL
jgi:predicted alpha/beta hydrolase family esterase